jgi:serine/threonine-protein kinase
VHRDVSPSNVLVSLEGEVKLCDFGIAHANHLVDARPLVDEAIKGKAGYMSPEQARAEALDARADVFAVGIVLWELLCGRRLYRPGGERSLLEQARRAEIPPLPERGFPDEPHLHAIVRRALAPNKRDRYPSAAAMLRDLVDYAVSTRLAASPLKLGEWVVERIGADAIHERRAREQIVSDRPPPPESMVVPAAAPRTAPILPITPPQPPVPTVPTLPVVPRKRGTAWIAWVVLAVASLAIAYFVLMR